MNASVRLLGAPRVAVGGVVHEPVASRASGLLYFLARSGEWTSRGDLCYLLWPDKTQELSQTSLRQLIHTVRDLPYAGELEVERERLRWQAETDLPAAADLSNGPVWGPTEYQQAPRFMAGFWLRKAPEFDSWLEAERDHWEARLRDDLVTSVDRSLAVGDADGALSMLAGWLRHQPLDHELVERVLSICRDVGRFEEGDKRFSEFSAALHHELGLKPSLTVLRAHAALSELAAEGAAREDGSVAVAIAAPPAGPVTLGSNEHTGATDLTRLTVPLRFRRTRFFGRERELSLIRDALVGPPGSIVGITGAGGMGKSRLAFEAARSLLPDFGGDVTFVPMAGVASPDSATAVVERALASGTDTGGTGSQGLRFLVSCRAPLLVIDDLDAFEDVKTWLEELQVAVPTVSWLITSRTRVAPNSATHLALGGLPDEARSGDSTPAPAVALFEERLEQADPERSRRVDRRSVRKLASLVGGMPLALEIAANVAGSLSLATVLNRLRTTPDLEVVSGSDLEARHTTVRAVFDATWAELTAPQRETLARMSVFRGGCDLAAATAVAALKLSTLASLRDATMLGVTDDGRVVQHPLIERFVRERVTADGYDVAAVKERHGHYYFDLLAEQEKNGAEGKPDSMDILRAEHANLEAAWSWALESGHWRPLMAARDALRMSYYYAGRHDRYWDLVAEAVAKVPEDQPAWAVLAAFLGDWVEDGGRRAEGWNLKSRAVASAKASGDSFALAWALYRYGTMSCFSSPREEHRRRIRAYEEADSLLETLGEVHVRSRVLASLVGVGETWEERERWHAAWEPVRASLRSPHADYVAMLSRAVDLSDRFGRHAEAVALLDSALQLVRRRAIREWAICLSHCADMSTRFGTIAKSLELAEEAVRLIAPYEERPLWHLGILARAHFANGDLDRARAAASPVTDLPDFRAVTLTNIALAVGDVREARRSFDSQYAAMLAANEPPRLCTVLFHEEVRLLGAKVALAEGKDESARSQSRAALSACHRIQAVPYELRGVIDIAPLLEPSLRERAVRLVAAHPGSMYVDRRAALEQLPPSAVLGSEDVAMAERQFDLVIADVLAALA